MEDDEDVPVLSNPLPPPPRPPPSQRREREKPSFSNLSNVDFRKMVLETPRRDEQRRDKDKNRSKSRKPVETKETEGEETPRGPRKYKGGKPKEGDKAENGEDSDQPSYRDRAEERRKDANPDYTETEQELGKLNAVGPPGSSDILTGEAHRISIEASKFLGGDLEHTHLVKGLDFALLQKVRSELQQKQGQDADAEDEKARARREEKAMNFRTGMAKTVYQQLVRPPSLNSKVNEMFLPGRTQLIFSMDDFAHEIPTTVMRSKDDCPPPEETVAVSVDGTVLERISRIMAYLRLGSSGKALKKKKKERDHGKVLAAGLLPLAAEEPQPEEEDNKNEAKLNGKVPHGTSAENGEILPPPPPRPRDDDDDIFVGAGVDYQPEGKRKEEKERHRGGGGAKEHGNGQQVAEDMEESPEHGGAARRRHYFEEPSGIEEGLPPPPPHLGPGPGAQPLPPPPPLPHDWQDGRGGGYPSDAPGPGPAYPPQAGWEAYPEAPPEPYGANQWPPPGTEQYPYPGQPYEGQYGDQPYPAVQYPNGYPDPASEWYTDGMPPPSERDGLPPPPPGDPFPLGDPRSEVGQKHLSQEEKDRGLGSVFKRDDNRLVGQREKDPRERDPTFISESYSECYPDYTGFTREIVESDDEEDLSKMDQGAKAKGRLHQWDFETEEEWHQYNESKEAMPKAAFQFGVKMADGRKTKKSEKEKEQKFSRELQQITRIMERRNKDGKGGRGEEDDYSGGETPGKRARH